VLGAAVIAMGLGPRSTGSRYGFCLVVDERRVVLGRVRRSAIADAAAAATAEAAMESGPSAVRFSVPAAGLAHRLAARDLKRRS
jgi:hypothetical protein